MFKVGQELPSIQVQLDRAGVVRYADAACDFNEIHYRDSKAQAVGLPGVVAHGMWTMGAAVRVVTDVLDDPNQLLSYFVRFTRPLHIPADEPATVTFSGVVKQVEDGIVTISISATSQDEALLGMAKAEVRQ